MARWRHGRRLTCDVLRAAAVAACDVGYLAIMAHAADDFSAKIAVYCIAIRRIAKRHISHG